MDISNIKTMDLANGTFLSGYEGEYVFSKIEQSQNYYEADILRKWFCDRDVKVVYDIGANIGNHTVYFAKHTNNAQIFSFEPYANNFDMLIKNVSDNNLNGIVQTFQLAAGDAKGSVSMALVQESNLGTVTVVDDGFEQNCTQAEVAAIDDMDLPVPDFVKIDVEGYELSVLKGMKKTLNSTKSAYVWIEVCPINASAIYDFMVSLGYGVADFSLATNNNVLWKKGFGGSNLGEKDVFIKIINDDELKQKFFEANRKYRELSDRFQSLKDENHTITAKRLELQDKLTLAIDEFGNALKLLRSMERNIMRLNSQVAVLQKENSAYQWKLNRIIGTWYGRIALKCYRMLRRLKRFANGLKKGYTK